MNELVALLRASPDAARALRDALRSPDMMRIALWEVNPYGQQNGGRYQPAPVCTSLAGHRLGWVAYAETPRTTARGVRLPAGWACWANVTGGIWPPHQSCRDQAHGLQIVTAALLLDGWTVHPLPTPSSTPQGTSGADTAAGEGIYSDPLESA